MSMNDQYDSNQAILTRMDQSYNDSISIYQSFLSQANMDARFEAGDQNIWSELYGTEYIGNNKTFNYNRIRRIINMVTGFQRRNRKSTLIVPVENGDQDTADQFTKLLYWAHGRDGTLNTLSDSFHGAITSGLNLLQVWVDYRSDPISGDIKVDNCDYNSFMIDPYFKKKDLSDCNFIWKRSYLTKQECISLLPEKADDITGFTSFNDTKDGKFSYMAESVNAGPQNLLAYDEYYYRAYRTQKLLVDTQTGDTFEWRYDQQDKLDEFLRMYPQVTLVDQEIPTVRVAITVHKQVMYDGPQPTGLDKYPFVPVFGYFRPQLSSFTDRIQGMVRGLRDAQFLYNRRKNIELDILESQVNSGWIYKEDALVNPKDIFASGQGKGIALKRDAQISDVQRIESPQFNPALLQISEILGKEIQEIAGVNEELLGTATDDKAGVLAMLRQGAGLTTLQELFDNLDQSQKLLGSIFVDIMQLSFTPGKVQRVLAEQPSPQFYNKAFGKYDAAIEEGLNTTTQKQTQFAQLLHLKEAGVPIPDDVIIEAATLQNKNDLIKSIDQQAQQAAQQEQQAQKVAQEEQQARTDLAHARAQADRGLGIERVSRVQENEAMAVEKKAEAQKDRTAGLLNMVKILQEIEGVDIQQLQQLVQLTQQFRQAENITPQEKQETTKTVSSLKNMTDVIQ